MSDRFRTAYRDFIHRVRVTAWDARSSFSELGPEVRSICDFGCADGLRVTQFLAQLYPAGLPADLVVHGLETDGEWREAFLQTLAGTEARFFTSADAAPAEEYDAVHLSSMLFDPIRARDIGAFLRRCQDGTLVAVRGWQVRPVQSEDSFVEEEVKSGRPSEPAWVTEYLRPLAADVSLKRIYGAHGDEPDAVVRQRFDLADGGVERAVEFQASIGQPERAKFMEGRFREMLREDPAASVAHDDVVYLYRIQR
jgi:hypothetical protein